MLVSCSCTVLQRTNTCRDECKNIDLAALSDTLFYISVTDDVKVNHCNMEATTIKPQGLVVSRLSAALLFSVGVLSLVAVALLAYSLAPCHGRDPNNEKLSLDSRPSHSRLYVRLPTSVRPHSYKVLF